MLYTALGIFAAIIFLLGDIPYLLDTIKGVTQPQRVTWGVVVLLNIVGFANQYASGAGNSLWLFGSAIVITSAIFIASIKHGVGGYSKQDIIAIILSISGILLWVVFDDPLFSILASIFVATVALYPTFVKAKINPGSETKISWLIGSISALLTAISAGELDIQLLLLPISSTLLQAYMVYLLYFRPRVVDES